MSSYSLSHLTDQALLRDLVALAARDRTTTAELLAHLAEVDERRLYVPAGYPSMYVYCVDELRLSEDAAYKRIQAARAGRQFPILFAAVADGRLHLAAVCLLAPHLTAHNAEELVGAATHRRKSEIERLLAERFPRTELLPMVEVIPSGPSLGSVQLAPGQVGVETAEQDGASSARLAPGQVDPRRSKVAPLALQRFALQFTFGQSAHDKLRYAQELLSHQVSPGDIAAVFERALDALIPQLEKTKFAATSKPRGRQGHPKPGGRYIPTEVKRAVWQRDGGRCTFVNESGQRCPARTLVEFDHVDPVARGGQATVDRLRLRCRAHNRYAAEETFGTEFMKQKQHHAQRAADARGQAVLAKRRAQTPVAESRKPPAAEQGPERDVFPWLRCLGFRADQARRAAAHCDSMTDASLEDRVRAALSFLVPPSRGRNLGRQRGPSCQHG